MLPSAFPLRLRLRLLTLASGRPPPDPTRLDSTRLGLDDDGTSARYFRPRSPCGASMSTARRLTWMIASELYRAGFPAPADVLSAALDSGVAISIILIFFWCVSSFSLSVLTFPPPPPLLILLPSFCSIAIQHHHPLSINPIYRISHRISHLPSFISSHLLHSLSILPPLRSCLFSVWKNPHADKLFLSFLSSPPIWLAPCSHVLV